ncbi:MAG TPA: hypothetical protein VG986_22605 [Pseudolabrys sp.]|nr:hypothetical protein [Pseudolabrys sp.]
MAEHEHEQPEKASGEPAATPNDAPKLTEPAEASATPVEAAETAPPVEASETAAPVEAAEAAAPVEAKSELPEVEAPSISPAAPEVSAAPEPVVEPRLDAAIPFADESPIAPTPSARSSFALGPRGKRNAMLAASVALAAALGAVIGAVAGGGFGKPAAPTVDVASVAERQAMQKSIAQLSHEVATLKTSVETANKSSRSQIAKISERLAHERAEITGSISAPRTTSAVPTPASVPTVAPPATAAVPVPPPRLPQQMAAIENPPAPHRSVVPNWTLQTAHDGYALIETRGEIYQVVLGVPVPGLGRVSDIKREDGRWVVVTPRGIIVSQRDRRYFEQY